MQQTFIRPQFDFGTSRIYQSSSPHSLSPPTGSNLPGDSLQSPHHRHDLVAHGVKVMVDLQVLHHVFLQLAALLAAGNRARPLGRDGRRFALVHLTHVFVARLVRRE